MKVHFFVVLLSISLLGRSQTADSLMMRYLLEQNIHVSTDNKVELLETGAEKFNDLFVHIAQAKHHIHLEYFNFRQDSISALLFSYLAERVEHGVSVRVIFDGFGNESNTKPLRKRDLKGIRAMGIDIVEFDPIRFPYLNHVFHRDHRKIVIIDGRIGYIGGMNVADYYIQGLPKIGTWHDMHARIEGSAVHDLQRIFLKMWNGITDQHIEGDQYFPTIDPAAGRARVAIVDRVPKVSPKEMRKAFVASIDRAQQKVQIINPYFLPTSSVKRALKRALKRGVKLEIMISAKSDIHFTPDAVFYSTHKLMKRGADIYVNQDGFHHTKTFIVDESFCTIGSANLNSRSLRYDYETNAFIFDDDLTGLLVDHFENQKETSTLMTKETWKERSQWRKFVGWFANLFSSVL